MSKSLISGRLSEQLHPDMLALVFGKKLSLEADANLSNMLWINRAHALMLFEQGIIDQDAMLTIRDGIDQVDRNRVALELDPNREDLYFNVEHAIMQYTGHRVGGMVHVGRSRNDLGATLARMRTRDQLLPILDRLLDLSDDLLELASLKADVIIPGYTHLQPAQPTTVGHYMCAIQSAISRDIARLLQSFKTTNQCPMGAAALAGTGFPIDRESVSKRLGFDGVLPNTLDAVASRDFLLQTLSSCTVLNTTLSRFSQDVFIWLTYEFGFVQLRDRISGTSSIMPQKKNPVIVEAVKGRSNQAFGALSAAVASVAGTNFSNVIDATTEGFTLAWTGLDATEECTRLVELIVENIEFNEERMLEHSKRDFTTVTQLADLLVTCWGISFREAHEIVGAVVRQAIETNTPANRITAEMVVDQARILLSEEPSQLSPADVETALDPRRNVESRNHIGGPAPASVRSMIEDQREYLDRARQQVTDFRTQQEESRKSLAVTLQAV